MAGRRAAPARTPRTSGVGSREKRFADHPAGTRPGRTGEDRARRVQRVVIERVAALALHVETSLRRLIGHLLAPCHLILGIGEPVGVRFVERIADIGLMTATLAQSLDQLVP